jgi:uncharacterized membrane protein YhiD involved in acid resistance
MNQFSALLQDLWLNFEHVAIAYVLTVAIGWENEREAQGAGIRT